jgi:hypothetical protein
MVRGGMEIKRLGGRAGLISLDKGKRRESEGKAKEKRGESERKARRKRRKSEEKAKVKRIGRSGRGKSMENQGNPL